MYYLRNPRKRQINTYESRSWAWALIHFAGSVIYGLGPVVVVVYVEPMPWYIRVIFGVMGAYLFLAGLDWLCRFGRHRRCRFVGTYRNTVLIIRRGRIQRIPVEDLVMVSGRSAILLESSDIGRITLPFDFYLESEKLKNDIATVFNDKQYRELSQEVVRRLLRIKSFPSLYAPILVSFAVWVCVPVLLVLLPTTHISEYWLLFTTCGALLFVGYSAQYWRRTRSRVTSFADGTLHIETVGAQKPDRTRALKVAHTKIKLATRTVSFSSKDGSATVAKSVYRNPEGFIWLMKRIQRSVDDNGVVGVSAGSEER